MQLTLKKFVASGNLEVIERKGSGHPDTLSDELAEALSRRYANYTLENHGVVLHHNFDKVGLLGGRARVAFGRGELTSPIRVLINGRASRSFAGHEIPVAELIRAEAKSVLVRRLPMLDPERDIAFLDNLSIGPSPGHVERSEGSDEGPAGARKHWFAPRGKGDVREQSRLQSNDTSVGCAHFPLTPTERLVLTIEETLNSRAHVADQWLGTDVKVMACRLGSRLALTLCVPSIAKHTPSLDAYRAQLEGVQALVTRIVEGQLPQVDLELAMNTKDDYELPELYLTAIGSSIESGDEGLVGRGNRPNGVIAMNQPYSMEGACGKNPVYHAGKIYPLVARRTAERLHGELGCSVRVWVVGQEGRLLSDPWQVVVELDEDSDPHERVCREAVHAVLSEIPAITTSLLQGNARLY